MWERYFKRGCSVAWVGDWATPQTLQASMAGERTWSHCHASQSGQVLNWPKLQRPSMVWCGDYGHLSPLVGMSLAVDRKVMHDNRLNTYSFLFNSTKIVLLPKREDSASRNLQGSNNNLLPMAKFEEKARESGIMYVLVSKRESEGGDVLEAVKSVLDKFRDVFRMSSPMACLHCEISIIGSIWFMVQPCHTDRTTTEPKGARRIVTSSRSSS